MERLFISQPMRGKTREEITAVRNAVTEDARRQLGKEIYVIDSFFPSALIHGNTPLHLLGKALELMATADVVYFTKGWEHYRGCRIEHECAKEYGVKILYER